MNNLKRISYLLTIVACILTSCEDWLDVAPVTQTEADELFSTEDGFRDALTGVYGTMSGGRLYGREMTFGAVDALAGYYSPIPGGNGMYIYFTQYAYKKGRNPATPCVETVDNIWNGMYNAIANVNALMKYIDAQQTIFLDDNYRLIKGEAMGLRAFLHLDLLRLYGAAYTVDSGKKAIRFVDVLSPEVNSRSSVQEVLDRIIADLEEARTLLANDPIIAGIAPNRILASATSTTNGLNLPAYHNRKYRFNYYAVEGALARAYLWRGDKAKALYYAKDILSVQASRFPWVQDKYLITITDPTADAKDRTFTTEHIFALNIRELENYIPVYYSSAYITGTGLVTKSAVRNAIYENDPVDPRNQYMFTSAGDDKYFLTKLYQDEKVLSALKYQMPLIRISEVFYIAAECAPSVTDGQAYLNEVRVARKLQPLTGMTTPEALQLEIQKEYQKEFMGEGQLWYYYKRMNFTTLPYAPEFDDTGFYEFDVPDAEMSLGGGQ